MTVITPELSYPQTTHLDCSNKSNNNSYFCLCKWASTADDKYNGEVVNEVTNKTTWSCPTEEVPTSSGASSLIDKLNIKGKMKYSSGCKNVDTRITDITQKWAQSPVPGRMSCIVGRCFFSPLRGCILGFHRREFFFCSLSCNFIICGLVVYL